MNQREEVEFSNILFNNENETFFYDKSLEFEINDFINDNQENNFDNDNNSSKEDEFEENITSEKIIPIFPSTKKLFYKKESFKEKEDNETTNKNITDTKNSIFSEKQNKINNFQKTFSRRSTDDSINSNKKDLKIDILNIILKEEKRTMIILEKIPIKLSQKNFIEEIDSKGFKEKYNLICFRHLNSKYINIYINFIHEFHIISFFETFNNKKMNSIDKRINIKYSNLNEFELKAIINFKDILIEFNEYNNIFQQIEIPLSYLSVFKKINPKAVCIIKEENMYKEGKFLVKKF